VVDAAVPDDESAPVQAFRGGSKVAADGSSNSVATSQFSSFAAAAAAAARGSTGQALYADTSSTDVAAYAARAAALGRSAVELGGEGINEGLDGNYWGPVDNDSARSKAEGDTLDIDQDECISCGTCVENTDVVFFLPADEGATAHVLKQEGPMDLVQDAVEACPVTCISWVGPGEEWVAAD
jgi:ferredoxin